MTTADNLKVRLRGTKHTIQEAFRDMREAADHIESLEAELAGMGDPSRTSKFEWGLRKKGDTKVYPEASAKATADELANVATPDLWEIVVRTITTTAWKKAEYE